MHGIDHLLSGTGNKDVVTELLDHHARAESVLVITSPYKPLTSVRRVHLSILIDLYISNAIDDHQGMSVKFTSFVLSVLLHYLYCPQ